VSDNPPTGQLSNNMSSSDAPEEGCPLTAPGGEGNAAAWTANKAASMMRSSPLLAPAKQLSNGDSFG